MARVSAVNALTIPELVQCALDAAGHPETINLDYEAPSALISGLAQVCRISPASCLILISALSYPMCRRFSSRRSAPSGESPEAFDNTHSILPRMPLETRKQRNATVLEVEWAINLVTRCPEHLLLLSPYCHHCMSNLLTVVAHHKDGRVVTRCAGCFRTTAFHRDVAVAPGVSGDEVECAKNRNKSRVRSKVEHVFQVLKLKLGFVKVRYRGLKKNGNRLFAACALVNLFMVRKKLLRLATA